MGQDQEGPRYRTLFFGEPGRGTCLRVPAYDIPLLNDEVPQGIAILEGPLGEVRERQQRQSEAVPDRLR